jgi:hypothetical protein
MGGIKRKVLIFRRISFHQEAVNKHYREKVTSSQYKFLSFFVLILLSVAKFFYELRTQYSELSSPHSAICTPH